MATHCLYKYKPDSTDGDGVTLSGADTRFVIELMCQGRSPSTSKTFVRDYPFDHYLPDCTAKRFSDVSATVRNYLIYQMTVGRAGTAPSPSSRLNVSLNANPIGLMYHFANGYEYYDDLAWKCTGKYTTYNGVRYPLPYGVFCGTGDLPLQQPRDTWEPYHPQSFAGVKSTLTAIFPSYPGYNTCSEVTHLSGPYIPLESETSTGIAPNCDVFYTGAMCYLRTGFNSSELAAGTYNAFAQAVLDEKSFRNLMGSTGFVRPYFIYDLRLGNSVIQSGLRAFPGNFDYSSYVREYPYSTEDVFITSVFSDERMSMDSTVYIASITDYITKINSAGYKQTYIPTADMYDYSQTPTKAQIPQLFSFSCETIRGERTFAATTLKYPYGTGFPFPYQCAKNAKFKLPQPVLIDPRWGTSHAVGECITNDYWGIDAGGSFLNTGGTNEFYKAYFTSALQPGSKFTANYVVPYGVKYPTTEYTGALQNSDCYSVQMVEWSGNAIPAWTDHDCVQTYPAYQYSYEGGTLIDPTQFYKTSVPFTRQTFSKPTSCTLVPKVGSLDITRDPYVYKQAAEEPIVNGALHVHYSSDIEHTLPYRVDITLSDPDNMVKRYAPASSDLLYNDLPNALSVKAGTIIDNLDGYSINYKVYGQTGNSWNDEVVLLDLTVYLVGEYYEQIISPVSSVYINGSAPTKTVVIDTNPATSDIDTLNAECSNEDIAEIEFDDHTLVITQVAAGRCTIRVWSTIYPGSYTMITVVSGTTEPGGADDEPDDYTNYPVPTDPEDPLEPEARAQHAYFYDMDWRTSQLKQHCGGFDHGIGRGKTFNAAPGTLYIVYSEHSKREYFRDGVRTEGMEDQVGKYIPTPLLQGTDVWHTDYEAPAFLDTGNIADRNGTSNKRFREVQYVLALDGDTDMQVAFAFLVDGAMRRPMLKPVAEYDPDADVITVSTEYDEPYSVAESVVGDLGEWKLNAHTLENAERVRVRQNVTGKGITASTRIVFKMSGQFKLLGVNYVYREMYSR